MAQAVAKVDTACEAQSKSATEAQRHGENLGHVPIAL
jgi:hypothetical protein